MQKRTVLQGVIALVLALGLLPSASALAAVNKPPRMMKAEMKDANGNGIADRVVLTYSEKINHKLDVSRFPFQVQGHKILKVNGARRSLKLTILLKENSAAPAKPASIKYMPTRQQPVKDLRKKQAMKQLLTKNIIGLNVTPPPPSEVALTVAKGGDGLGTVTSSDSKINCGTTCTANYTKGSTVTLTAAPDTESKAEFAGWDVAACGTATSCQVTMDAAKTVTATFNKPGSVALTIVKNGTGTGTVTSKSTPAPAQEINCGATCSASYTKTTPATVVTLTATPDTASKSVIAAWSGGGCTGTQSTCNVTMDAAKTVTVTFNKPSTFGLTVVKSGTGQGKVTSSPAGIDCGATCTAQYAPNTVVTLTAEGDAASGSLFSNWDGGGCTGSTSTCNVTMDAAKTVTAVFNAAGQSALTVNKTGTGTGSVTSSDSKINCGATCQASYAPNSAVTLTAAPESGSVFAGWSGGGCTGTSLTCNVTMTQSKTVTATFNLPATVVYELTVTKTGVGSITYGTTTCGETLLECPRASFPAATIVTITATAGELMKIESWGGACAGTTGSTCKVTMDAAKAVSVTFGLDTTLPGTDVNTSLPPLPAIGR